MKTGAYPFAVSGDISANLAAIRQAVICAHAQGVRLLVFPECALTGYPPRNLPSSSAVNWQALSAAENELQHLSAEKGMCIVAGAVTKSSDGCRSSALAFTPAGRYAYHKRALWGWDRDNFIPGNEEGILEFEGLKIGIRICYEIRFPEYFRELYRAGTDLNIVLFHDVADTDDPQRYDLIKAHIRTRAAENTCPLLAVNSTHPFPTAPTMLCDSSGSILAETVPGTNELLIGNYESAALNFSESGRKTISDSLIYPVAQRMSASCPCKP